MAHENSKVKSQSGGNLSKMGVIPPWLVVLLAIIINMQIISLLQMRSLAGSVGTMHESIIKLVQGNQTSSENADGIPKDLGKAWIELKKSTAEGFKEEALAEVIVPSNLDAYFTKFLANDAQFSVANYQMEEIGDTELDTSKWQAVDKDGFTHARVVKYRHPVSNPMAPPTALAEKRQKYRKYGKHGILLETQTEVKDVPKTDCFVVDDRILIEAKKNSVVVSARFEIRFTKKTMFRPIIEKTTTGEFMKWFSGYGEMIKLAFSAKSKTEKLQLPSVETKQNESEQSTKRKMSLFGFPLPW